MTTAAVVIQPKEEPKTVVIIDENSDDDYWEEYQPRLCGQKNHPMFYEHRVPFIIFANYLGLLEIMACLVAVLSTDTHYLLPQMLILLILNVTQLYDYFLGFVLACYVIFFENLGIAILIGFEQFKEGFSFIYYLHPGFTEKQHFIYVICTYVTVFWLIFRFCITRRAVDYVCAVRDEIQELEAWRAKCNRKKPVETFVQL